MSETETKSTAPAKEDFTLPHKKPSPKRARFTSREQIIFKIDKFTDKAKRQRGSQNECYLKAAQLRRHSEESKDDEISAKLKQFNLKQFNRQGDNWGRKADRLEKDVLPKLRQKLAEFDTDTIPGITGDRSVPGL